MMQLRILVLVTLLTALGPLAYGTQTLNLDIRTADGAIMPDLVVILEASADVQTANPSTAIIEQRNKRFVPRTSVIQTGTVVEFPNNDSVGHHVYSFARPNTFELPLYTGKIRPSVRFDDAGIVTLGCNIHDSMLGYVVVVDTPYFGMTNSEGRLTLRDLPPDSYQLYVWSPEIDALKTQHIQEISLKHAIDETLQITLSEERAPHSLAPENSLDWDHY